MLARRFASNLAQSSQAGSQRMIRPSIVLNRMEEHYRDVLAEDLMVLKYDHLAVNPDSPYRKAIHESNASHNASYHDAIENAYLFDLAEDQHNQQSAKSKPPTSFKKHTKENVKDTNGFKRFLDPAPTASTAPLNIARTLPTLKAIQIDMTMLHAVSHSKRVLLNGLLALNLVTGVQASIARADFSDARTRVRKGMPIGVSVRLQPDGVVSAYSPSYSPFPTTTTKTSSSSPSSSSSSSSSFKASGDVPMDPVNQGSRRMFTFLEKLTEIVLPKLRDFSGFPRLPTSASLPPSHVRLSFDAEAWTSFPEIEAAYLKFPQLGSVGCLQPFTVTLETSAQSHHDARLLLSGYRVPFCREVDKPVLEKKKEEEYVHEL